MAANLDSVIAQLSAAGLILPDVGVQFDRFVRCRVAGMGKEKCGWYRLHEFQGAQGDWLIAGSYGVYSGNNPNTQKIRIETKLLSPQAQAALRASIRESQRKAEEQRRKSAASAARRAAAAWAAALEDGESPYLAAKRVPGVGVRYGKLGEVVVPMCDTAGRIHGIQIIRGPALAAKTGRLEKEFWPPGHAKRGHFYLIGPSPSSSGVVVIGEGLATMLSIYAATQLTVCVAFDAGNLMPVGEAIRKRWPDVAIIYAADDDDFRKCGACGSRLVLSAHPVKCPNCGADHGQVNPGVDAASAAAIATKGKWLAPLFADPESRAAAFLERGVKRTDFNDLHAAEGLAAVRAQIESALPARRLKAVDQGRASDPARDPATQGGGERAPLRKIQTREELLSRFALVYGQGGMVFDRQERILVTTADVRDACTHKEVWRGWAESPDAEVVRVENVGFDPTECDAKITCNLWAGWPTKPRQGSCERLLDLLRHMCSHEGHLQGEIYQWVLRWLALPIQKPGTKLKTCLVLHGPQGVGKNLFFEAISEIYGPYGGVLDQSAVEDKYNDWASRKLFLICDEVVARNEVWHVKNKLKSLITGDWLRINPKHVRAYNERNSLNLLFLSNEVQPVALDEDDRRHCVIWTADKLPADYYRAVLDEIANGGVAALHHYLLHLDLGDFHAGSPPPMTRAKRGVIELSRDTIAGFFDALMAGDIVESLVPALVEDAFGLYRVWCARQGQRPSSMTRFRANLERIHRVPNARKRWRTKSDASPRGPHSMLLWGARAQAPDGVEECDHLGTCVVAWRNQAQAWIGEEGVGHAVPSH
jgi:putative DNA primase/helicase